MQGEDVGKQYQQNYLLLEPLQSQSKGKFHCVKSNYGSMADKREKPLLKLPG